MNSRAFVVYLYFLLQPSQLIAIGPIDELTAQPDVTSVVLRWEPCPHSEIIKEYEVKRNGISVGSTVGRHGYFTDYGLLPNTIYSYQVVGVDPGHNVACQSETIQVQTASHTTIKTHYRLLAVVFNPGSVLDSELNHIKTFLKYRLDFLRDASHNSVLLELYGGDIISINALPPLFPHSTQVDYATLAVTPYRELGENSFIDVIEKYDADIIWVLGSPGGYDFGENILMGSKNLGNNTWISTKVKSSRSFFIHSNSPDARAFDAAAHHIEGTMTSATDKDPVNWPRDKEYLVYTKVREDYSVYSERLHLFEQFRLTDEWNGTGAFASKGNASCGSSHFVPGSIRNSANYPDYTYYDIDAWQRYVDCHADRWLVYPDLSGESRKINGFDFGAFNNYTESQTSHSFRFGTSSFHFWWFNHIPHNSGVTDGKLNNWWPYIYDCNRFDGTAIDFPVYGFPSVSVEYAVNGDEYGTEVADAHAWAFWHTCTDFGQRADVSAVEKTTSPNYVKSGQYSIKVDVDVESFSFNGRNDVSYPKFKNAHWILSNVDSISLSVKFFDRSLIRGTNPIIRICQNGNNRIEYVPKTNEGYTNLFNDNRYKDESGWFAFRIPLCGDDTWERNVIGYIDPDLDPSEQEVERLQLIRRIIEDVNYIEVSIQADGGRGQSIEYYIDDLRLLPKDTATISFDNLNPVYDGTAKEVAVSTIPAHLAVEITYDGAAFPPVNAGIYEVAATVVDPNYQGTATGQLEIQKAQAAIELSSLETTYDGQEKSVTATTEPGGLSVEITYDGSADPPINAGIYQVAATVVDPNYQGTATGQLEILKANTAIELSSLETIYDGRAKSATATTEPGGLRVEITYDGSADPPVNAGIYEVAATVVDPNYQGTATGQLEIRKATAAIELSSLETTYDRREKSVTAATDPSGLFVEITYDGVASPPINAGIYEVAATVVDPNYQGTATGQLEIHKATAAIDLSSLETTYDGQEKSVTATTEPGGLSVEITYDGSADPPINAGIYQVAATVVDPNYQGTATGQLEIHKATAAIELSSLETIYDGMAKSATATTQPDGLFVEITYEGAAAPPVHAGVYEIAAMIHDPNYEGSAHDRLIIRKASLTARANDTTRLVGETNPEFTITYIGFVKAETEAVLETPPIATCDADASSEAGVYEISLTGGNDDNYNFTYVSGQLIVQIVTALNETKPAGGNVYPNPVSDYFRIVNVNPDNISLTIFDMRGNKMYENRWLGGEVDVRFLSSGVYILRINTQTVKLIKK